MKTDGTWETLNKRERLFKTRQREKLQKTFGSIADMTRQPAAIFIVDILKEHIAMKEATRLNIPVFGIVDTNVNPKLVDFPIPANDDATKSISVILGAACDAIKIGLEERKASKDSDAKAAAAAKKSKKAAEAAAPVEAEAAVVEAPAVEAAPVTEAKAEEAPEAVEEAKAESKDSTEGK
jgi:small subunit ribosomal protein S2